MINPFKKTSKILLDKSVIQGEILVVISGILWSLFPVFSKLSTAALSPLYSAAISVLIAAVFFAIVITIQKQWHEIKIKSAWGDILLATFIIGVLFYSLLFIGIHKTTAGNAGIIGSMEIFFSMLILGAWKKENLISKHIIGAILMVLGTFIILFPGKIQFNQGDLIILIAAAIPPVGNYFAQKARKQVSANMIMFIRSLFSGIFILFLATLLETSPGQKEITSSMIFILINGFFILGISKIFWIEAIHRIPITKALSLASIAPAFTLIFAYILIGETPNIWQVSGFLPMLMGIFFLTEYNKKALPTENIL